MLRAPAITPDARYGDVIRTTTTTTTARSSGRDGGARTVSFTALAPAAAPSSSTTDGANGSANDDGGVTFDGANGGGSNDSTRRQYSLYRSAPNQYPSYERLRFVRLPGEWLPAALRGGGGGEEEALEGAAAAGDGEAGVAPLQLCHWPALAYRNLAELVRDLSPNESRMLKAKLILEHRKSPRTIVARLLGWNSGSSSGGNGGFSSSGSSGGNPFEETKLELIRLSGDTLDEVEARNGEQLISFVDGQLEFDNVCDELLTRLSRKGSNGKTQGDADVARHVLRFRRAVDAALNCLALDMGDDPLPARGDDEAAIMAWATPTNRAPGGSSNGATARKSSLKTPSNNGAKMKNMDETALTKKADENAMVRKRVTIDGGAGANDGKRHEKRNKRQPLREVKAAPIENRRPITAKAVNKETNKSTPAKGRNVQSLPNPRTQLKVWKEKQIAVANVCKKDEPIPTEPAVKAATKPAKSSFDKPMTSKSTSNDMASVASRASSSVDAEIPWKLVWNLMKKSGWSWRGGSGLMTDYFYVKPGCKVKGGTEGRDYFVSVEDTQCYARYAYGWGAVGDEELLKSIADHGKYAGESVPPLKIEPREGWREVWEKMLRSGWTWKAGSGLMMDYFYVKPGCKIRDGREGWDYFVREEDVRWFAKRNYGWRGDSEDGGGVVAMSVRNGADKRRSFAAGHSCENSSREKRRRAERAVRPERESSEQPRADWRKEEAKTSDPEENEEDGSTFSDDSGFRSKKLFPEEECVSLSDKDVPPLGFDLDPHEPWQDVWEKMRKVGGWTWRVGSGLMTDYYYMKPGCKVKGGTEGRDYFVVEEDVRRFARKNYGWRGCVGSSRADGSGSRKRNMSASKSSTQGKRRQVEKGKPTKPEKIDETDKKAVEYEDTLPHHTDPHEKKALWQALQKDGWRAISAGKYNRLHDWYYVRPGCDPGDGRSRLGVEYYLSEEDAIASVKCPAKDTMSVARQKSKEERLSKAKVPSRSEGRQRSAPDGLLTPADCKTKPQDPAVPLLPSPDKSCRSSRSTASDLYEWNNLWQMLQRAGWTCMKAGKYNRLHDWYYVRPGRDPGDPSCELDRHYFACPDDVVSFVRRLDEGNGGTGKKSRKSMGIMLCAFEEEA